MATSNFYFYILNLNIIDLTLTDSSSNIFTLANFKKTDNGWFLDGLSEGVATGSITIQSTGYNNYTFTASQNNTYNITLTSNRTYFQSINDGTSDRYCEDYVAQGRLDLLKSVAYTNSYNDLSNKPTIPEGLSLTYDSATKGLIFS